MDRVTNLFLHTRNTLGLRANAILKVVLDALGEKAGGRTGGYLRVFVGLDPMQGPRGWKEVFHSRVGEQEDISSWERYKLISMEKALRLMKRHALDDHVSSAQSRNEKEWEYSGAFIVNCHVLELGGTVSLLVSFSGLPEKGDEAVGLLLLSSMLWSDVHQYSEILAASHNRFASELLQT